MYHIKLLIIIQIELSQINYKQTERNETNEYMKKIKFFYSFLLAVILTSLLCMPVYAKTAAVNYNSYDKFAANIQKNELNDLSDMKLYPGGMPFGVRILSKGLCVIGFSEKDGINDSPAYHSGVRIGDIITKINDKEIVTIEDFTKLINENGNQPAKLTLERGNSTVEITFTPIYHKEDNSYKAGLWLKDSTSGIGTVTFVNPENGIFGGLGHGICEASTGDLVPLSKGIVMDVCINGVKKGVVGTAGELQGSFNLKKIGSLIKNTKSGVFGVLSDKKLSYPEGPLPIAKKEEVKEGDAYIWCTLSDGLPHKYAIQISNIDTSCSSVKNFRVKVVDPLLLSKTGGIVQGMSGSPIIQNGKLIGAVTHVLINDPTSGYGIFIENMLSQIDTLAS